MHVDFICTWTYKCLISVRKLHALPFILCYELNSEHATPDLFCNYYHIQYVYSTCGHVLVVIFHFATFLAYSKFYR
jgi:hypothetical protein